ncbi:Regulator of RpoS [Arenibacter antarcticus]|uniref:Response regulator n=1 Tax=Arenibacter antarcticus TaxID=2040469 RepID=A0ABW5VC41_9FLAO|nr:response regulator [Arenibacter sp. H213]MCM4169345.1 transcriptional regulator [Arenibacter sp. H213]
MKRVLIIEDDSVLRENTAELLELSYFQVYTASNGSKGLLLAKQHLPDLIICDIMMPELDGYGVLMALSQEETTKQIPFVFLSAKTERQDIRKGMDLGADDYITKPFTESELLGAINSRLARMAIVRENSGLGRSVTEVGSLGMQTINQLKNYIVDEGRTYEFVLGDVIYKEGSNSNLIYLVLNGVVKTHRLDEWGKELITEIYKADDFFGFTCFSKNLTYQEFATAMGEVRLVGLGKDEFKVVLEENPQLTMELMAILTENLSETKEQLLEMAYGSVRKKTATTILKFANKLEKDSQGRLHILRSDLASVAGMATETLIRTLSSFKKEGLIRIENKNIQILDMEGLSKVN